MQQVEGGYADAYAAFSAPRTHKFKTVDFRVPHTPYNLRTLFPETTKQRLNNGRIAGLLGIFIGLCVAVVGFGVDQLQRGLTIGLYTAAQRLYRSSNWLGFLVFILISLVFVLVACLLVVYVAPLGAGSGIPELKAYLNGVRYPSFLAIESLFVKAVGIGFSISSGLICGKQGPMIHAGAIVGAGISQAASATFRFRLRSPRLNFLRTEQWKRDFTAVGAAVGVAAAFGSPMGAWMWVYEEACTYWTWELGLITLGGCLSAAMCARVLNFLASGLPGGFGTFTLTQFGKLVTPFAGSAFPLKDIPAFLLVGIIGGMVGAVLPLVNKVITLFRHRHVSRQASRIVETLFIGLLTALIRFVLPYLANDCRSVDPEYQRVLEPAPLTDFSQFTCEEGLFSPWAAVIYNPTDTIVRGLLYAQSTIAIPTAALAAAFVYFFVFMIWTYGIAVPAGIFFPGFLLGSVYGRLIGQAVQSIFPDRTDVSLTGYAFLGAVSALAGITRTISVAVIALEATGGNDASFASVFVALIAKLVGDFLYPNGIYDLHINLKGIPFLEAEVPELEKYNRLRVADVMQSSVIGIRRFSRVSALVNMMHTNGHHAFPVFLKVEGKADKQDEPTVENTDRDGEWSSASMRLSEDLGTRPRLSSVAAPNTSSILTPTNSGMEATIYDEGRKRVVWLADAGMSSVAVASGDSNQPVPNQEGSAPPQQSGDNTATTERSELLDYQLIGTIDRATLLVLVKHELDKKEQTQRGLEVVQSIARDELDAAWPNAKRMKGDEEEKLLKRVMESDIGSSIIDLINFIDPDPLLISHRAPSTSAYRMFRRSGARHILVANMRMGRISGIMTRKDVLPESVSEVLNRAQELDEVKLE